MHRLWGMSRYLSGRSHYHGGTATSYSSAKVHSLFLLPGNLSRKSHSYSPFQITEKLKPEEWSELDLNQQESLLIPAHAKINLSLDVLGKRSDGYHELRMVMQQLSLADQVRITLTPESGIRLRTDAPYLPTDHRNIAWQAANLLGSRAGINLQEVGVEIAITKRIPVAAGLGGGSADAAAVLLGLNQLWRLGLSVEELQLLGVQLGADVPYCLMGGTALAEGIGERLSPQILANKLWVVLVKPPVSVSTRDVYGELDLNTLKSRPDILALLAAMAAGDTHRMDRAMANVLESVTTRKVPDIIEIKRKMLEYNAFTSLMSGSGPTVFGLFRDREKAQAAGDKLQRKSYDVYVAHTISSR